jgi:hypothetical protein
MSIIIAVVTETVNQYQQHILRCSLLQALSILKFFHRHHKTLKRFCAELLKPWRTSCVQPQHTRNLLRFRHHLLLDTAAAQETLKPRQLPQETFSAGLAVAAAFSAAALLASAAAFASAAALASAVAFLAAAALPFSLALALTVAALAEAFSVA